MNKCLANFWDVFGRKKIALCCAGEQQLQIGEV